MSFGSVVGKHTNQANREHSGSLYLIFRSKLLSVVPMPLATPAIRKDDIISWGRSSPLIRDNAIYDFCKKSVENGLDIFRVFDSLNYIGMPFCRLERSRY